MTEGLVATAVPDSVDYSHHDGSVDYDLKIHLVVREKKFVITRDELMLLPESILLCLFPNGAFLDREGNAITNLTEDDTVYVNFDSACFEYILATFGEARNDLEPSESNHMMSQVLFTGKELASTVLQHKPAIIVLREDLDFYIIPPIPGLDAEQFRHLKLLVGTHLLENKRIFLGLGYNTQASPDTKQKLGPAEQHLLDMLCLLGFDIEGEWGSRLVEPLKCVISLLLLVRLNNKPPETPPELPLPLLNPVTSTSLVSSTRKSRLRFANLALSASRAALRSLLKTRSQTHNVDPNQTKLLLFWRKPARKCWWLNNTIEFDVGGMDVAGETFKDMTVKVHIRRVWTLELSVIGVQ